MPMFLRKVSLGVLILLGSVHITVAQGKLTLGAGMGLPELANLSARYQIKQTQLGLSYGSAPWSDDQARPSRATSSSIMGANQRFLIESHGILGPRSPITEKSLTCICSRIIF